MKLLVLILSLFLLCNAKSQTSVKKSNSRDTSIRISDSAYKAIEHDVDSILYSKEKWHYSTGTKDGTKWYFMNTYQKRENGRITIWLRETIKAEHYNNKIYKDAEEKILITIDCNEKRYLITNIVLNSSAGSNIGSQDIDDDWEVIVPDTVFEVLCNDVCEAYNVNQ